MIPSTPARTSAFSLGRILSGPATRSSACAKNRTVNVAPPRTIHVVCRNDGRILFLPDFEGRGLAGTILGGSIPAGLGSANSDSAGSGSAGRSLGGQLARNLCTQAGLAGSALGDPEWGGSGLA